MDNVGVEGRVFYTILFSLERYFSVLSGSEGGDYLDTSSSSSGSSSRSSGGAEIISTRVAVVAVGRGGDYLDTCRSSSDRRRWRLSRELWTTNCPLVLAVVDPGKGVCAHPVNGDAILGKGDTGPKGGSKERQLSPDREREKT